MGVAWPMLGPHYTGGELVPMCAAHALTPVISLCCSCAGEDLKKIHQGTWVAWKQLGDNAAAGGPLFVKDAFYNFLCPQRPRTV